MTDADFRRHVEQGLDCVVTDYMMSDPKTFPADAIIDEALTIFEENK